MNKYTEEFERLWKLYPKRRPSNPKIKAFKAFSARLKQGYSYDDMKSGLIRYIACKEAEGQIGTQFIMLGATFFGPDEWFLEEWEAPKLEVKKDIGSQKEWPPNFDPSRQCSGGESVESCKRRAWQEHERRM